MITRTEKLFSSVPYLYRALRDFPAFGTKADSRVTKQVIDGLLTGQQQPSLSAVRDCDKPAGPAGDHHGAT